MSRMLTVCAFLSAFASRVLLAADLTQSAGVKVGDNPGYCVTLPDGSKTYIADAGDSSVWVVNHSTKTVSSVIYVGPTAGHFRIALSPSGEYLYALAPIDTLTIIRTDTDEVCTSVSVPSGANVVFAKDDVALVATIGSGFGTDSMTAIRNDGTVIGTAPLPESSTTPALAVANNYVLVARQTPGASEGTVTFIDLATMSTIAEIGTGGQGPVDIAVNAATNRAFIANFISGNIGVIDIGTFTLLSVISMPGNPYALTSWDSPGGSYVFAACDGADVLAAINAATGVLDKTTSVPGINSPFNNLAIKPDGKLGIIGAAATGEIHLVDTDPTSNSFMALLKSCATGVTVGSAAFSGLGDRAYVVDQSLGRLLEFSVSGGADSIEQAVSLVVDAINILLDGSLTKREKNALKSVRDKLIGSHDGKGKNGAIDKMEKDNLHAALVKMREAVHRLYLMMGWSAVNASGMQKILSSGAMSEVYKAIKGVEATAGAGDSDVADAWSRYNSGVQYHKTGSYVSAMDCYDRAWREARKALQ